MIERLTDIADLNNLEFVAAHITEGFMTGLHKSPFHGFSAEFNEHRLYNKGESTRHIDWKLYARTDKLFVKRYEEETNLRCYILIDTSSSMRYKAAGEKFNKLEFSSVCAAAIINLLRTQRDAVALTLFDRDISFSCDAKVSTVHAKMLFSTLQKTIAEQSSTTNAESTGSIAKCLHTIAESIHKRSLVLIFSDLFDTADEESVFAGLQHLRHAKHDVVLFHVLDRATELDFNFENRPYKFVDMESGKTVALNPLEYKETYRSLSSGFCTRLKQHCGMYNMDYVEANISKSFKEILVPYLLKRSVMH
ncbi:MAG: DUF58 domain-containing protein [Bacteroidales bacterium]|nr:DUF58 domain-containing protein [Bacteroidales bacterium]MBR4216091.1 DUF58 domain-containing protein [Bacteroidales bacterium]